MGELGWQHLLFLMGQIAMYDRKLLNNVRLSVLVSLTLTIFGCVASSADLNKMAQDALQEKEVLNEESAALDQKFLGTDRDTIRSAFGKPREISYEPYPYSLDRHCRGSRCEGGVSDEIWFYQFKKRFSSGWVAYSLYVYFKDGKVVRIR